jgi:hypothetical protein
LKGDSDEEIIFSFLFLVVFSNSSIAAVIAECSISIDDNSGSIHTIKHKFYPKNKNDWAAQRKHFKIPGHDDYSCTLAFYKLKEGTMLSCEYLKDMGHTFFQSDRSTLQDENTDNNLSFRHRSAQIYIKTKCM